MPERWRASGARDFALGPQCYDKDSAYVQTLQKVYTDITQSDNFSDDNRWNKIIQILSRMAQVSQTKDVRIAKRMDC